MKTIFFLILLVGLLLIALGCNILVLFAIVAFFRVMIFCAIYGERFCLAYWYDWSILILCRDSVWFYLALLSSEEQGCNVFNMFEGMIFGGLLQQWFLKR